MEYYINSSAINMAGPRITPIRPPILSDPKSGMRRNGMRGINAIRTTGRLLNKSIPIGVDIALVSVMTRIFIINTITAREKVGIKDSMASVPRRPPARIVPPEPTSSGVRPGQPTGPGVRPGQPTGPSVRPGQPTGPGVHPAQPAGPTGRPATHRPSFVPPARPARVSVRLSPPAPQCVRLSPPVRPCVRLSPPVRQCVRLQPPVRACVRLSPPELEPLPLASVNLKNRLGVKKNRSRSSPAGARAQIAPPGRSGIILPILYCVKEIKVSPV